MLVAGSERRERSDHGERLRTGNPRTRAKQGVRTILPRRQGAKSRTGWRRPWLGHSAVDRHAARRLDRGPKPCWRRLRLPGGVADDSRTREKSAARVIIFKIRNCPCRTREKIS